MNQLIILNNFSFLLVTEHHDLPHYQTLKKTGNSRYKEIIKSTFFKSKFPRSPDDIGTVLWFQLNGGRADY